jgi:hypothetical protein
MSDGDLHPEDDLQLRLLFRSLRLGLSLVLDLCPDKSKSLSLLESLNFHFFILSSLKRILLSISLVVLVPADLSLFGSLCFDFLRVRRRWLEELSSS